MRVLNSLDGIKEELEAAKREAQNYFNDEKVLLERFPLFPPFPIPLPFSPPHSPIFSFLIY